VFQLKNNFCHNPPIRVSGLTFSCYSSPIFCGDEDIEHASAGIAPHRSIFGDVLIVFDGDVSKFSKPSPAPTKARQL
jgi:hypothetical protein